MIKLVIGFLLVMAAIGMVGNAMFPGSVARGVKKRFGVVQPASCPRCRRYIIGKSGCDCGKT